jgi:hypothetical protein
MDWASAGGYFDTVADALIQGGASDELKTKVCSVLIGVFRSEDWDTPHDSLNRYAGDSAIVQAFREHGVFVADCCDIQPDGWRECELEDEHAGDHDDERGHTWPRTESADA